MRRIFTISKFAHFVFNNKICRRSILILGDTILSQISIFFSLLLFYENINFEILNDFFLFKILFVFISIPIYVFTGQYSSLTSYLGAKIFLRILLRNLTALIIVVLILNLFSEFKNSLSFLTLFVINLTLLNLCFRYILRKFLFLYSKRSQIYNQKVAIYGAGNSGINLASNLNLMGSYELVAFIDEDSDLWSRNIGGVPIVSPLMITDLQGKIDKVLISIKNLRRSKRNQIIRNFQKLAIDVIVIPSINDVASGKTKIDDLNPLRISDLISRDEFTSKNDVLFPLIEGKIIFVTGAGGSIGSELCLQILKYKPKKLILLERSEINLYKIEETILEKNIVSIEFNFILGCATNEALVSKIIKKEEVQIVLHTAAYKHVPIVERNPIQGLLNNVFSTKVLCNACLNSSVENFCLISTDKAVRPTNIMGASKRLAEMIVQSYSQNFIINSDNKSIKTCFSMVRFGNVLDSSGSVVPRFKKQIKEGGPVTITHPEITRFFMTISEAANLVLESIIYAKGGDLFLLDMGKPILIKELALQMIKLSGLQIKNKDNPDGDIEIIYTGLRPGEKLYEELLIDAEAYPTLNNNIFRAKEKFLNFEKFLNKLEILQKALINENEKKALLTLKQLVPEWHSKLD